MATPDSARLAALKEELARCYAESAGTRRLLLETRKPLWIRWPWLLAILRALAWLASGRYALLTHWLHRRTLRRSGVFDAAWYLATYPDVAAAGVDPLGHYVRFGAAEGRQPNRYFVPEWYGLQSPHLPALRLNPLVHYLRKGAARGLSPYPGTPLPGFSSPEPEARSYPTTLHRLVAHGLPAMRAKPHPARPVPHASADGGRRVCAFSHFDAQGRILGYVRYYLDCLAQQGFEVHFISTSPALVAAERAALEAKGICVYTRENRGRDFGSWQWALREIPALAEADTLLLANDSVFGPLFDLGEVFAAIAAEPADLWGITDSSEVRWHLQSYFLCFSRRAHRSAAFQAIFAQDFSSFTDKRMIVDRGEVALSQALIGAGLSARAYCPHERIGSAGSPEPFNPTYYAWDSLIIGQRCPFLKRELFLEYPSGRIARWRAVVEGFADYDSTLIDEYLSHQRPDDGRSVHPGAR